MRSPPASRPPGQAERIGWSIADVERDTGLGKDTLRVWERRYGFPQPRRDALGERLYPPEQVQRLQRIKRLLDAGHRPGKVVPLDEPALQALQGQRFASQRQVRDGEPQELERTWLQWLRENRTDRIKQALQAQILGRGLATTVEQWIAPLCVRVGEAWWQGEISIYQEHLFTETLQSVLREAIASVDAMGQSVLPPRVLLTTLAGEQHGLGLLMAECFFALESCERFVLGVSTPVADIVQAVQQLRIEVLALSFSANASRRDLGDGLQQLLVGLPAGVEVWAGGAGALLHGRWAPPGVRLVQRASDLSVQIRRWREERDAASGMIRA